jgi:L-ascorbate metabolism protein UlaG (beta-lactamase superfamily)
MGRQTADVVTVSHGHPHHGHTDSILGDPRVLSGPGAYEIGSFYVVGLGTDRGEVGGVREINTVYSITCEGVTLCHLGDLNTPLSPRQQEELGHTEVLFAPAGGLCTLPTGRIAEVVNNLTPRIVVPLHYQTPRVTIDLEPVDGFLSDMGVTEPQHESSLTVTATNLPRELSVTVLDRSTGR